jgi:hypothetical protein
MDYPRRHPELPDSDVPATGSDPENTDPEVRDDDAITVLRRRLADAIGLSPQLRQYATWAAIVASTLAVQTAQVNERPADPGPGQESAQRHDTPVDVPVRQQSPVDPEDALEPDEVRRPGEAGEEYERNAAAEREQAGTPAEIRRRTEET